MFINLSRVGLDVGLLRLERIFVILIVEGYLEVLMDTILGWLGKRSQSGVLPRLLTLRVPRYTHPTSVLWIQTEDRDEKLVLTPEPTQEKRDSKPKE